MKSPSVACVFPVHSSLTNIVLINVFSATDFPTFAHSISVWYSMQSAEIAMSSGFQ